MESSIELALFAVEIIGGEGPILVDTCIAQHNFFLEEDLGEDEYDKLCKEDVIEVGCKGRKITRLDLKILFAALQHRRNQEIFQNNRTYIFEGVTEQDKNLYTIDWGTGDYLPPLDDLPPLEDDLPHLNPYTRPSGSRHVSFVKSKREFLRK